MIDKIIEKMRDAGCTDSTIKLMNKVAESKYDFIDKEQWLICRKINERWNNQRDIKEGEKEYYIY